MTEEIQGNSPEARDPTGTLVNQPTTKPEQTNAPASAPAVEAPKPAGAPEAYSAWALPEGFSLDAKLSEGISPIFKELGLDQTQAQKLVDFYVKQQQSTGDANRAAYQAVVDGWRDATMKDPEMGPKIQEVQTAIGRAKNLLSPQERSAFDLAMNTTGLGNHPDIIRALWKISQNITEGTHVSGAGPSVEGQGGKPAKPSMAQAMYPNLPTSH